MSEVSIVCPKCGESRLVKREWAGKNAKCVCGASIVIPSSFDSIARQQEEDNQVRILRHILAAMEACAAKLEQLSDGLAHSNGESQRPRQKQYKVLTQKDKWFSGKFDPEVLEKAMNAYAEQGWSVRGVTTAAIPGFGGNREELIVVLER